MLSPNLETACHETVYRLCLKYKSNPYLLQRLHTHVNTCLEKTLDNEWKNFEKRKDRTAALTMEQQSFAHVFLNKNQYYYLPSNNCFYEYDGVNYSVIKEDDILYKLLSNISKDRFLMQWKYKTKSIVIKKIKERNLYKSIPESETIQNVLGFLCPGLFESKQKAKYFLTIIGDNILKKSSEIICLVSAKTKRLLQEFENVAYITMNNTNATHNFMTKYHETAHNYTNCRLLNINDAFSPITLKEGLKNIGLNLLCVAIHYSNRYNTSDNYLAITDDDELTNYALYLKTNSQSQIVDSFCSKYLIETADPGEDIMRWKDVHYIWKLFIRDNMLQNMIYSATLKNMLKDKFEYNESLDTFPKLSSKLMPSIKNFILFWDTNIESVESDDFENELDIEEAILLYKNWCFSKQISNNLKEIDILNILKHFSNVEISEDKYILNVKCLLWDKQAELNLLLSNFKETVKESNSLISFDQAYVFCTYHSLEMHINVKYNYCVSKRYFEKHLYATLSDYIVFDNFISIEWCNS